MLKIIEISFALSFVYILGKHISLIFTQKISVLIQRFDLIESLVEFAFVGIVITIFFLLFVHPVHQFNRSIAIGTGLLLGSFLISYNFILYPILILIRKKKYITLEQYQIWLYNQYNENISVRVLHDHMINAYATGFSKFKVIFLTYSLLEKMDDSDIKNLIYHEMGHLKNNHLLILYVANILCCALSVLSASLFFPYIEKTEYPGFYVFIHGSLFGLLYVIIPGLLQRRMELNADRYAASRVGGLAYRSTLFKLNALTDKGLEKRAINYPTLNERLKNVEKI